MKIKIISTLAILTVALASCKKDYTCSCQLSVLGQPLADPTTETINDSKKKAEKECEDKSATITIQGIPATNDCKIID